MIGKKLTPILVEIEETLLEFNANNGSKPEYGEDGLRAGTYIFMSVLMDKVYDLQEDENIDLENRIEMVTKLGDDLRKLIKTYTNIDTHTLYK